MLKLWIPGETTPQLVKLEHSLLSLAKWESEKEKPFFPHNPETEISQVDMFDYFAYMVLDRDDEEEVIRSLSSDDYVKITQYINSPRTATTVREIQSKPGPKENVSSELIYYWMISFNIPFECDKWHLNRLITLIRICSVKNSKPEKVSPEKRAKDFRRLNEERKKKFGTSG